MELLDAPHEECVRRAATYASDGLGRLFIDGRRREALVDAVAHIAHEILEALDGQPVGAFVTSVSTGSTLRHVASTLRQFYPSLTVVGVRIAAPEERALFYADVSQARLFNPDEYRDAHYHVMEVTEEEAWTQRAELARTEGLLLGPKGASAVLGALDIRQRVTPGSAIVALSIDGGHRYLGYEPEGVGVAMQESVDRRRPAASVRP